MRYKILFIGVDGNIPTLVSIHHITKMVKVEAWLDSEGLLESFGLEQVKPKRLEYVV